MSDLQESNRVTGRLLGLEGLGPLHGPAHAEVSEDGNLTHSQLLERAREQAAQRGFDDMLLVDCDFHQTESQVWHEMLEYMSNDVIREFMRAGGRGAWWLPGAVSGGGWQQVGGRIQPQTAWIEAAPDERGAKREIALIREAMSAIGSDYVALFPTNFLSLGTNPISELEPHLARAYARWMTERLLAEEPGILTLMFLPFSDPDACLELIAEYGSKTGVIGYMVTSTRNRPVHGKEYVRVYAAIQEQDRALAFHSNFNLHDRTVELLNKFISVHSLGFPYYNMVQATNWIMNGMMERFPRLKVIFIESGLAWLPFLMQRLDHEFQMRSSEAPLLRRLPSEYLREFYYTSQPLEAANKDLLEVTFRMINAETQLLWASDWPHWDWDPPSRIWDLPFLDDHVKRQILGLNAQRLFRLSNPYEKRGERQALHKPQ